jgi:hypothetical protein
MCRADLERTMTRKWIFSGLMAMLLVACTSTTTPTPVAMNDGELALPADYKTWPKFLSAVQRPDAKQVREIYMNPIAQQGTAAKGFPNGSVFVMENFAAAVKPDGTLQRDAEGKLVKEKLVSVFVQGKNVGWGEKANPALANGNWIYSAYTPSGEKSTVSTDTCRVCHLPQASKDFVHRYDEYFATRKTSAWHTPQVVAALNGPTALSLQDVVALHTVR